MQCVRQRHVSLIAAVAIQKYGVCHERLFDTLRLPDASGERLGSCRAVFVLSPAHYVCGRTGRYHGNLASLVTRFDPLVLPSRRANPRSNSYASLLFTSTPAGGTRLSNPFTRWRPNASARRSNILR